MQGQSQDQDILVASRVATISEVDHANTKGWVMVESRRKPNKKSGCSPKGKEVVVYETRLDVSNPVTLSSPLCPRTVRPISPSRPDPLVIPSCDGDVRVTSPTSVEPLISHPSASEALLILLPNAGEASNPSPSRNNLLEVNVMAGDTERALSLDVSDRIRVRTRSQKNHGRSGRGPPSPTLS